ncbi:hypothetical protein BJY04DRAFT_200139 [Aspergillus karnatakaensis]|uniref:uncharacterized protein n=1 Tax=Aspergillus karnatakaensis TaxID=1810916 RepID=UPI003CCE280A
MRMIPAGPVLSSKHCSSPVSWRCFVRVITWTCILVVFELELGLGLMLHSLTYSSVPGAESVPAATARATAARLNLWRKSVVFGESPRRSSLTEFIIIIAAVA